jgi:putative transposase
MDGASCVAVAISCMTVTRSILLLSEQMIESAHIDTLPLPARSPNLNTHAERWVRSVKAECLSKIIPFGERPLRRAMNDYLAHYHTERNHQGKNNVLLFRQIKETRRDKPVRCRDRLGGLLRYYHRAAA